MWFYYNFHNFISSSILGGFVLHVLKTCCCRAVSPNPYKEGYSRHQSLGKILQIFSFIKNQNNLFWERLSNFFSNFVVPSSTWLLPGLFPITKEGCCSACREFQDFPPTKSRLFLNHFGIFLDRIINKMKNIFQFNFSHAAFGNFST